MLSFHFRSIGSQSFPMAIREGREFAAMPPFGKLQIAFCGPIIATAGFIFRLPKLFASVRSYPVTKLKKYGHAEI